MRIIVEILLDESQWPADRLDQYMFNLRVAVGGVLEQTVWYRNDISPDQEYSIRKEP